MRRTRLTALLLTILALAGCHGREVWKEADDPFMGEYEGTYAPGTRALLPADLDVVGEAPGEYRIVLTAQSPGTTQPLRLELAGRKINGRASVSGSVEGAQWSGLIVGERLSAQAKDAKGREHRLTAQRVTRRSPTEGQKPPAGAVVLLAYEPGRLTSPAAWKKTRWAVREDGSLEARRGDLESRQEFGDVQLHVEFMLPYEPSARGQARANSGAFLQGRYEVQVLDSFGLPASARDCGAIYRAAAPRVNACLPPGRWQTFDIVFRPARFDAEGELLQPASLSVAHNGVEIHREQPVERGTRKWFGGGPVKTGPLVLQDHGHPVRYRNIWLLELKEPAKS